MIFSFNAGGMYNFSTSTFLHLQKCISNKITSNSLGDCCSQRQQTAFQKHKKIIFH